MQRQGQLLLETFGSILVNVFDDISLNGNSAKNYFYVNRKLILGESGKYFRSR